LNPPESKQCIIYLLGERKRNIAWVTARKGRGDSGDEKLDESLWQEEPNRKLPCCSKRFERLFSSLAVFPGDKRLGFLDKAQFRLFFLGALVCFGLPLVLEFCFGIRLWGGGR